MRRKPYLSLLLAVVILGGMFALFPTIWMLLVIALLALITLQAILVRRNLYTLPPGHSQLAMPPERPVAPMAAPPVGMPAPATEAEPAATAAAPEGDAAPPPAAEAVPTATTTATPAPAAAAPAAEARPNLDTELFSRFRRHLEQAEAEASGKTPPRATPPPDGNAVQDRVELSGAARKPLRRAGTPGRQPAAKPAAEAEGADIFEDLRPAPLPAPPPPPPAPKASPPPAADGSAQTETAEPPAPPARARRAQRAAAAPGGDDVGAALADRGPDDAPGIADEAAALLHLAEESSARGDWDGLRAGLDNYIAHLAEAPRLVDWRARRLQVRLAVHDRDANRALQAFEDMLSGFQPAVDDVPRLLNELLAGAEREAGSSLRVSMLVRILAIFRQARDQRAMDRTYGWIEDAQEQVGDERRLLQYLKNHLEIRKVLNDVQGQLELIDQLGNRCYRLGLTDEAKEYYEMGLRLRAENETPNPRPGAAREG